MDTNEPHGVAVIVALFEAHAEGRLDDMLRLVAPDAVWEPATRPARDYYLGKDGAMALFADLQGVYGDFRVECHAFEHLDDDQIRVTGSLIRTAAGASEATVSFSTVVVVRDGLITSLTSSPAELRSKGGLSEQSLADGSD